MSTLNKRESSLKYFSKLEYVLWLGSAFLIVLSFSIFDRSGYFTLIASLIGVTSLIYCAKGNPFGQLLMIAFSILYGIISFTFSYYGEMITYVGMTLPMSIFSLISWMKNPYDESKSEVRVNKLSRKDWMIVWLSSVPVTIAFYFILSYFNTANIIPSTLSVTTSFIAAFLTYKRSAFYAIGYAVNDLVLIVLWVLATMQNIAYLSVVVCFITFFVNDMYAFINWRKMQRRQS